MSKATLDGAPIAIEDAYQHAAKILGGAKFPVVAGLATDAAGARAAILLAERLRGAYDHLASDQIFNDLDVTRSFGMFITTPAEARARADVVLLVGPGLTEHWPALFERLALGEPARFNAAAPSESSPSRAFSRKLSSPPRCSTVRRAAAATRSRTARPRVSEIRVTRHRFGRKRVRVLWLEWLTLLPVWTAIPVSSQRRDIAQLSLIKTG